jgi:hypothetical protein
MSNLHTLAQFGHGPCLEPKSPQYHAMEKVLGGNDENLPEPAD